MSAALAGFEADRPLRLPSTTANRDVISTSCRSQSGVAYSGSALRHPLSAEGGREASSDDTRYSRLRAALLHKGRHATPAEAGRISHRACQAKHNKPTIASGILRLPISSLFAWLDRARRRQNG